MPVLLNTLSLDEQIIYAAYILCRPEYFVNLEDASLERFQAEIVASNRLPLTITVTHPSVCKKKKKRKKGHIYCNALWEKAFWRV